MERESTENKYCFSLLSFSAGWAIKTKPREVAGLLNIIGCYAVGTWGLLWLWILPIICEVDAPVFRLPKVRLISLFTTPISCLCDSCFKPASPSNWLLIRPTIFWSPDVLWFLRDRSWLRTLPINLFDIFSSFLSNGLSNLNIVILYNYEKYIKY